jgi:DNA-directed RNA polymerase specialized sigma24 family protein
MCLPASGGSVRRQTRPAKSSDEDLGFANGREHRRPLPRPRQPLRVVEPVVPARTDRRCRSLPEGPRPAPRSLEGVPRPWSAGQAVESEALKAALAALPDPWGQVVILRDVDGRPAAEVSAATGLTAEQQRGVLNRSRELLREELDRVLQRSRGGS